MTISDILIIISNIFLVAGLIFMAFGILGLFRFNNFFLRIMSSSKVDTVGTLTIIFGMAIRMGLSYFSAKLVFLAIILIILGPLCHHMVARSAYLSGYKTSDGLNESDKYIEEEENS